MLKRGDFLGLRVIGFDDAYPVEVLVDLLDHRGFGVIGGAEAAAYFFDEEEGIDEHDGEKGDGDQRQLPRDLH